MVAEDLCFGQVPTIVGTPGVHILGTEGPDVVITNSAAGARTLGGDDLLCITGTSGSRPFRTGSGSDRIDSSAVAAGLILGIYPGSDPDELVGGPAGERIRVGATTVDDLLGDTISTAGGNDHVYSAGEIANHDVIRLGSGRDVLAVSPKGADGAVLDGGPGQDTLRVLPLTGWSGDWVVDNRRGVATRDDKTVARWSSFSDFSFKLHANVTFLGGSSGETLDLQYPNQEILHRRARVDLRMGGGTTR